MVVETRKRKKSQASSSKPKVEVAAPPKKLKVSTTTTKSVTNTASSSSSTSRLAKADGQKKKYKESEEIAREKLYPQPIFHFLDHFNYFGIPHSSNSNNTNVKVAPPHKKQVSTLSTAPSEIPKRLYDLIQYAARARRSLKLNSNNRFAKRKLEYYEPKIPRLAMYYMHISEQLPSDWIYDPETSFMAHVPKPPPPPPKPKPKTKKKNKIKITWSSPNYHGGYPLTNDEQKVWNMFRINDTTEANSFKSYPMKNLVTVEDDMVVDLLGKFAVDTFNKSCHMYVNKDEDNKISGAEFVECKFYKLTKEYIFYMTIEAIEQGIPGVYTTKVECKTESGARTLLNFRLMDDKPKWNRPWVKPHLESEVEYETVQDGSSDPEDYYKLTGMVHRWTETGGFNYHNPAFSGYMVSYDRSKDKEAWAFEPNVSQLLEFPVATKTIPVDC